MRFKAYGHRNVLATHKKTLEFTKKDFLTIKGDCILGIKADFKRPIGLSGKIRIRIRVDELSDEIIAYFNNDFDSDEMVIRKSDYIDKRTFAINADKAACDIDREIVRKLKDPKKHLEIEISTI